MSSFSDRALIALGLLPLVAAGAWLTVLRKPETVSARAASHSAPALRDEQSAEPEASFIGVVLAGQDAELGAESAGEVTRVFIEPGARVSRGDPLLQLASLSTLGATSLASAQATEDRSALAVAKLNLETARDKARRMASAASAYAARNLSAAQAEAARAAAELAKLQGSAGLHRVSLQRELARAEKQLVRAPFDGVLAGRFVNLGDHVNAGQILARVVDDTRFVRFAVPSADHARLQIGQPMRIYSDTGGVPLTAVIADVDPELDSAAALGFARAALQLDAALSRLLPPGTRVRVTADSVTQAGQRTSRGSR